MFLYNLIFFYVPFKFYTSKNGGNEYLVFAKCVLLLFANIATVFFIYSIVDGQPFRFDQYPRSTIKLFALLAMIPFVLFYLINRERYKRMFKYFNEMNEQEKKKWNSGATIYIYSSILLVILFPFSYAVLLKLI
jgi:hypothetical protein